MSSSSSVTEYDKTQDANIKTLKGDVKLLKDKVFGRTSREHGRAANIGLVKA
jgi:hypothetical protein